MGAKVAQKERPSDEIRHSATHGEARHSVIYSVHGAKRSSIEAAVFIVTGPLQQELSHGRATGAESE